MLSKTHSIATIGLHCETVEVETDIHRGLSAFAVVGLGDTAVQESKERVRSAIKNANMTFPNIRIIVNLAPADVRKKGPSYDLAIAVGILLSSGQISVGNEFLEDTIFIGELALNGNLRHISGVLPTVLYAKEKGFKRVILPKCDAKEASLVKGIEAWGIESLNDFIHFTEGGFNIVPTKFSYKEDDHCIFNDSLDFKHIKGQDFVKRALEICASGSHNIILNGSPGSGKTLMAKSLQTILPKMSLDECLEVTKIYSVANKLSGPLIRQRPFRSIHHTASSVSIVGGGSNLKPGEISLAHRGILFLDEIAEFPSFVLEVLRQPIEDHCITISRASGSVVFPSKFTLVGAMNPCNCGYYNVPNSQKECDCSAFMIEKYQKKISGPLLDRIDVICDVSPVEFDKLYNMKEGEPSCNIRKRVQEARNLQLKRFKNSKMLCNSEMSHSDIKKYCKISEKSKDLLKLSASKFNLSARSIHRILKLARTIADLGGREDISFEDLAESLQYRRKEN